MMNSKTAMRGIVAIIMLATFTMCAKKTAILDGGQPTGTQLIRINPVDPIIPANPSTNCSYTIQPSEWQFDGSQLAAGSVLCVPAGTRGALLLKNLKGTPDKPIIIINKGGQVTFTATLTGGYTLKTTNCQYFKIMGNGVAGTKYGFVVNGGIKLKL